MVVGGADLFKIFHPLMRSLIIMTTAVLNAFLSTTNLVIGELVIGELIIGELVIGELVIGELAIGELAIGELVIGCQ